MPLIISIEGGDQAGKKTQSNMLVKVLDSRGVRVSAFSFPDYTTPVGKVIKNVLNGKHTPIPQVIHCLMSANRWEMAEKIRQASKDNHVLDNESILPFKPSLRYGQRAERIMVGKFG